jgi:hypothetical protein
MQPKLNISQAVVNFYFFVDILAIYGARNPGVPHLLKIYFSILTGVESPKSIRTHSIYF